MYIDMQVGLIAMVQGRVADANTAFASARRAAKADLLEDEGPMVLAEVLSTELRLERNKAAPPSRRSHKVPLLARSGAWVDVYVAASEAAIELTVRESGVAKALDELEEIVVSHRASGLRHCTDACWRCARRCSPAPGEPTTRGRLGTGQAFPSSRANSWISTTRVGARWRPSRAPVCGC